MSIAKMISDDFRDFQRTGRKVVGRDGRNLISFITKNDNIEVMSRSMSELVKEKLVRGNVIYIRDSCRLFLTVQEIER